MPSAIYGVPHINKAPLFFCSAGDKDNCTEALKRSITASTAPSAPATWPLGKQIRCKFLHGQKVIPGIEQIIRTTVLGWTAALPESVGFQWVNPSEPAEIRISFHNNEPNWSALGAKAILYDENKATMNFSFGGWKENLTVFPHATIARVAAHLFGHALGLPHAVIKWSSPWNKAALESNFGSFWADIMKSEKGNPDLQNSQSIMAYDCPASLGSGTDEYHGGSVIDSESLSLLKRLYSTLPSVYSRDLVCGKTSGWRGGIGNITAKQYFSTSEIANIITGITRIDMGLNGNFRLSSVATSVVHNGFDVSLGTWGDTHILDASCSIMSFGSDDPRILTGRQEYVNWVPDNQNVPGRPLSRRIIFKRPWKKAPSVVAFISGLDFAKGRNLRCEVSVSSIDQVGFTLNLITWGDSIAYNIQAGWLAHETDEYSIRTGILNSPQYYPRKVGRCDPTTRFVPVMPKKPQALFRALTYIDTSTDDNLRFEFEAKWDHIGVEGTFQTWSNDSGFFCLRGCYVAVL